MTYLSENNIEKPPYRYYEHEEGYIVVLVGFFYYEFENVIAKL
jgi:hypothetical protein